MSTTEIQPIRVLLVDDHPVVRAGLAMVIESHEGLEIVGEAQNRAQAIALAEHQQPDIILLDLDLGGESGLDLLPELLEAAKETRVLILTGLRDREAHRRAIRLGAMGVIFKDKANEVIISAIMSAHAGEVWIDRSLMKDLLAED